MPSCSACFRSLTLIICIPSHSIVNIPIIQIFFCDIDGHDIGDFGRECKTCRIHIGDDNVTRTDMAGNRRAHNADGACAKYNNRIADIHADKILTIHHAGQGLGKSGQFPLHTWLPDAMAGPTPVSSLLHSSTMVVAGVFLVARLYPVFHVGLDINVEGQSFNLIAVIGGITVLVAAGLAFVQNDIKKVLAYSTVSQLGYMMMGLGVGAWMPAVFHIFTHAFFKCCLFLCAGSVAHTGSHHSFDMKTDMGGLRKKMPITFITWVVSTAALCGLPFVSGFFSKDEIIDSAKHNDYKVFWIIGLAGAFMTTAYMTRATYLTFFGKPRGGAKHFVEGHDDHGHDDHGHDAHDDHGHAPVVHGKPLGFAPTYSPWQITVPLLILAALAVVSGYLNAAPFHIEKFGLWLESSIGLKVGEGLPAGPEFSWANAVPSIVLVAAGFAVSAFLCVQVFGKETSPFKGLTQRVGVLKAGHTFLVNKYYLDDLYEKVVVKAIAHPIAQAAYWVNQHVIDGIVNRVGLGGKAVGQFVYRYIDQGLVDGVVNGSGTTARGAGGALQPVQSGKVSMYGALLFGAAAVGALVLAVLVAVAGVEASCVGLSHQVDRDLLRAVPNEELLSLFDAENGVYVARDDVDEARVAVWGVSQAGYWVPRALTVEQRFAAAVVDPGVVDVSAFGGKTKEFQAEIDLDRMRAFNLTLPQIMAALGASNSNVGGRTISIGEGS